ncbi:twin-arginine translocase subunit TatC [Elusimicrobiota bacterium]
MTQNQSFISHLEELRKRIIYSVAGILVFSIIAFFFHDKILVFLRAPIKEQLVFIAPQEAFIASLKISLLAGIIVSSPVIIFHIWKFMGSALKKSEKKILFRYIPAVFILFLGGAAFGFKIVLPIGLKFLLNIGGGNLVPMISVGKYISFIFLLTMVFGIAFQLPLVMHLVTSLGFITRAELKSGRRYAVVFIFIAAALLTPPDVFTQIALALPVILLYELGLLLSKKRQ